MLCVFNPLEVLILCSVDARYLHLIKDSLKHLFNKCIYAMLIELGLNEVIYYSVSYILLQSG